MNRIEPIVDLVPYLITNRGTDTTPIFREDPDYYHFLELLATATKKHHVCVLARNLVPTEFRLILEQMPGGSIPAAMHSVQTGVASRFNKRYNRTGRLFAGPYRNERIHTVNNLSSVVELVRQAFDDDLGKPDSGRWLWVHAGVSTTINRAVEPSLCYPPAPTPLS